MWCGPYPSRCPHNTGCTFLNIGEDGLLNLTHPDRMPKLEQLNDLEVYDIKSNTLYIGYNNLAIGQTAHTHLAM